MKSWKPLIVGDSKLEVASAPGLFGFLSKRAYRDLFDELVIDGWASPVEQIQVAVRIADAHRFQLILLGRRVAKAFRLEHCPPYSVVYNWGRELFPHHWAILLPSVISDVWAREPEGYERARELVKAVYPYDLLCRRSDLVEVRKVQGYGLDEGLLVRPLLQEPVPDTGVDGSGEADGRAD